MQLYCTPVPQAHLNKQVFSFFFFLHQTLNSKYSGAVNCYIVTLGVCQL